MKKIFTFILAVVVTNSFAQTDELKKLVQQSFTYFPRVQEANTAVELGEKRVDIAQSGYLPTVTGNGSYSYVDPIGQASFQTGADTYRTIQFQPNNNYNANVGLNQLIWDFGRTQSQIDKSKAELQVAQSNSDQVRIQLASQIANIYYGLIFLKKAIAVEDSVISFYDENMKIVEGRVRQGDALRIDVLNIQTTIDQSKTRRIEFIRLFNKQLALLKYTTGTSTEPGSDAFDFKGLTGADFQNNPEFLAAQQRILAAEADSRYAHHNQMPNLNFQAAAGVRNGYQPDIDETRFNYLVGAGLTIPIFHGGRVRQNIALADKNVDLNKFALQNVEQNIVKDLAVVQSDVNAYSDQLASLESQISQAREALRLTEVRYRQGVSTYLDLLNATTNLQRAVLNQINIEYQRCQAYIEQARLTGTKFWE
jgi:outer membrane protein TolC